MIFTQDRKTILKHGRKWVGHKHIQLSFSKLNANICDPNATDPQVPVVLTG